MANVGYPTATQGQAPGVAGTQSPSMFAQLVAGYGTSAQNLGMQQGRAMNSAEAANRAEQQWEWNYQQEQKRKQNGFWNKLKNGLSNAVVGGLSGDVEGIVGLPGHIANAVGPANYGASGGANQSPYPSVNPSQYAQQIAQQYGPGAQAWAGADEAPMAGGATGASANFNKMSMLA